MFGLQGGTVDLKEKAALTPAEYETVDVKERLPSR